MSLPVKRPRLEVGVDAPADVASAGASRAAAATVVPPPQLVLGAHSRGVPRTVWEWMASWLQFRDVGRLQSVARGVGAGARVAFAATSHLTIRGAAELGCGRGGRLHSAAVGNWALTRELAAAPLASPVAAHARLQHLTVDAAVALDSLAEVELVLLIRRCRATLRTLHIDCACTSPLLLPALRDCAQLEVLHLPPDPARARGLQGHDMAWPVAPRLRALSGSLASASLKPLYLAGKRLAAVYGAREHDGEFLVRHPVRCLDIDMLTPSLVGRLYRTLESLELHSCPPGFHDAIELSPRVWRLVAHWTAIQLVRKAPGLRALSAYVGSHVAAENEAALVRVLASASAAANLQVLRLVTHSAVDVAPPLVRLDFARIGSLTPGLRVLAVQATSSRHGDTLSALAAARSWPRLRALHLFPWAPTPPAVGVLREDDSYDRLDLPSRDSAVRTVFDLAAALAAWPLLTCLQLTVRGCTADCESARCVEPRSNEGSGWAHHSAAAALPPLAEDVAAAAEAEEAPCAAGSRLRCLALGRGVDCLAALPLPALRSLTVCVKRAIDPVAAISWEGILHLLRGAPGISKLQLYLHDALSVTPLAAPPAARTSEGARVGFEAAATIVAAAGKTAQPFDLFGKNVRSFILDGEDGRPNGLAAEEASLRLPALRHFVCNVQQADLDVCRALVCGAPQIRSLHGVSEGLLRALCFTGADVLPLLESITFTPDVLATTLIYWAHTAPRLASLLY